jgi:hypothetical protein
MCRKKSSERGAAMTAASRSCGRGRRQTPVFSNTSGVACTLLTTLAALTALGPMSACIVPIPAEPAEDPDGGTKNGYPAIIDVNPAMPGPISIALNSMQEVTLTLADSDLSDTLRVRIFRDYDKGNTITVRDLTIPPPGTEQRLTSTTEAGWCNGASQTGSHQFDVVVADRDWDPNATENYNRTPLPGGKTSVRSWVVQCTPAP